MGHRRWKRLPVPGGPTASLVLRFVHSNESQRRSCLEAFPAEVPSRAFPVSATPHPLRFRPLNPDRIRRSSAWQEVSSPCPDFALCPQDRACESRRFRRRGDACWPFG
jgi:hypothetical protein